MESLPEIVSTPTAIPRVTDILDVEHIQYVYEDTELQGFKAVQSFFTDGANKAPIKKPDLHRFVASSSLIGEMRGIERLMNFLENSEVVDAFDPKHEVVQAIYGDLCMYLLKLDKLLLFKYQIKSSILREDIEERSQEYLDKFYLRREKITKLQEMISSETQLH